MSIVKVDRKGRITLPKRVALQCHIRSGQSLLLKPSGDSLVLKHITPRSREAEASDPLLWLMRHPAKVRVKNLKKTLAEIEDEMWSS